MNVETTGGNAGSAGASESTGAASTSSAVESAATANTNSAETTQNTGAQSAGAAGAAGADGQVIPPAYQPNFKFKFAGKEHEIEELFRGVIKDQDTEKKVKDLFQRSLAFDDSKTKWEEKVKTHYEPTVQQFQALDKDVTRVMGYRNAGDWDSFFHELQVPESVIIDWAKQRESLAQNPEQKALADQAFQERRQRQSLEQQLQDSQGQMTEVKSRERAFELDLVMAQPQVTEVAQKIETMMGEGAFRQLVIDEGTRAWALYKRDLTAQEAVNMALQRFGKIAGGGTQSAVISGDGAQQTVTQNAGAQQKPPIIPNVNGKGTSPVKKVPKSIDDLKNVYKEKFGNG